MKRCVFLQIHVFSLTYCAFSDIIVRKRAFGILGRLNVK